MRPCSLWPSGPGSAASFTLRPTDTTLRAILPLTYCLSGKCSRWRTLGLLDQLKERRATARAEGDEILTRAAAEGRDLTAEELTAYQLQVAAEREAADAMEAERD